MAKLTNYHRRYRGHKFEAGQPYLADGFQYRHEQQMVSGRFQENKIDKPSIVQFQQGWDKRQGPQAKAVMVQPNGRISFAPMVGGSGSDTLRGGGFADSLDGRERSLNIEDRRNRPGAGKLPNFSEKINHSLEKLYDKENPPERSQTWFGEQIMRMLSNKSYAPPKIGNPVIGKEASERDTYTASDIQSLTYLIRMISDEPVKILKGGPGVLRGNGSNDTLRGDAANDTAARRTLAPWLKSTVTEGVTTDAALAVTPRLGANQGTLSENDIRTLAYTLLGEAEGEGPVGMLAVANVINNRAHSPFYPNDPIEVALQPWQFSTNNGPNMGGGNQTAVRRRTPEGSDRYNAAVQIVQRVFIDGDAPDLTGNSISYHATNMTPYWASGATTSYGTYDLGHHRFYPRGPVESSAEDAINAIFGDAGQSVIGGFNDNAETPFKWVDGQFVMDGGIQPVPPVPRPATQRPVPSNGVGTRQIIRQMREETRLQQMATAAGVPAPEARTSVLPFLTGSKRASMGELTQVALSVTPRIGDASLSASMATGDIYSGHGFYDGITDTGLGSLLGRRHPLREPVVVEGRGTDQNVQHQRDEQQLQRAAVQSAPKAGDSPEVAAAKARLRISLAIINDTPGKIPAQPVVVDGRGTDATITEMRKETRLQQMDGMKPKAAPAPVVVNGVGMSKTIADAKAETRLQQKTNTQRSKVVSREPVVVDARGTDRLVADQRAEQRLTRVPPAIPNGKLPVPAPLDTSLVRPKPIGTAPKLESPVFVPSAQPKPGQLLAGDEFPDNPAAQLFDESFNGVPAKPKPKPKPAAAQPSYTPPKPDQAAPVHELIKQLTGPGPQFLGPKNWEQYDRSISGQPGRRFPLLRMILGINNRPRVAGNVAFDLDRNSWRRVGADGTFGSSAVNAANQRPEAMQALAEGRGSYTVETGDNAGALMPTRSIGGGVRNTYGD